ncbi:MAG: DUF58 domain-containing protein [Chromatiaceae bacterium]|nr:MAG: DUF58 domain-containing protein [Chromatiaceae bacterium]
MHRTRLRGRGMDYRESRHYQPGDDIRTMDWRVTARAGHPHVKRFDEERERPVMVLADFAPSMFFASQGVFKSVLAARLAALIGWATIAHGDRIGALLSGAAAGAEGHLELAPAGGRRGQLRLIRALVAAGDPSAALARPAAPAGTLGRALGRLRRVVRPGSLIFLLSDFHGSDAESARHLRRLAQHNDLTAIWIADPLELAPPPPGRYPVSDGHGRGLLETISSSGRARYAAACQALQQRVMALSGDLGIPLLRCTTDADPVAQLAAGLGSGRIPWGSR